MVTQEKKEQTRQALIAYLKRGEGMSGKENIYSANKLAATLGYSGSLVSQVKNGNWANIADEVWNTLRSHLRVDGWKMVVTENYNRITQLCKDAQSNHRFLAVAAFTGAGKTKTLTHYAQGNQNVFYVHCNRLMTQKSFLQEILRVMGLDSEGSKLKLMDGIIKNMHRLNDCLLILDDFAKVTDNIYQLIQQIYDETVDRGIGGIVIAGTEVLKNNLYSKASRNKLGFRELKRRIGYWLSLRRPTRQNVQHIVEANADMELGKNEIDWLYNQVKTKDFGTLRELLMNLQRATLVHKDKPAIEVLAGLNVGDYRYEEV